MAEGIITGSLDSNITEVSVAGQFREGSVVAFLLQAVEISIVGLIPQEASQVFTKAVLFVLSYCYLNFKSQIFGS